MINGDSFTHSQHLLLPTVASILLTRSLLSANILVVGAIITETPRSYHENINNASLYMRLLTMFVLYVNLSGNGASPHPYYRHFIPKKTYSEFISSDRTKSLL